jgi:hypothetical protein
VGQPVVEKRRVGQRGLGHRCLLGG